MNVAAWQICTPRYAISVFKASSVDFLVFKVAPSYLRRFDEEVLPSQVWIGGRIFFTRIHCPFRLCADFNIAHAKNRRLMNRVIYYPNSGQ